VAAAEIKEVLAVDYDKLFETIVKYENYPQFVAGCSDCHVDSRAPGKTQATFLVNLMKEVSYTLDLSEDKEKGIVFWSLVKSDFMSKNNGRWELKKLGPGKTEAKYSLELDLKFPVPGLIMNRLVKGSLPAMLKNFEKQAQKG
jgi:ribosome-associated toxin RatA of RatAB toxin-antitoxin module